MYFIFFLPVLLLAQSPAKLSVSADAPARIEIDGKPAGVLQPGMPVQLDTVSGEHQLLATPESGGAPWRKLVLVSSALPTAVAIPMKSHLLRTEIQKLGYWADERTKLQWAAADNGSGVTVSQATTYCRQLSTGGFHDWRLPEIDELQRLFGGPSDEKGFRVLVPLTLSGWAWSATRGNEPTENWTLDFGDGARASVAAGDAGLNRALCVRNSGN